MRGNDPFLNHFWSTRADHTALQSLWDEGVTLLGEMQLRSLLSHSHCGANDAPTAIERTCGAGDDGERLVRQELAKDEYGLHNLRALGSEDAYLDIGGHIGLPHPVRNGCKSSVGPGFDARPWARQPGTALRMLRRVAGY